MGGGNDDNFMDILYFYEKKNQTKQNKIKKNNSAELHITDYRISSVIRQSFFLPKQSKISRSKTCKMDLDLWDCLGRLKLVL